MTGLLVLLASGFLFRKLSFASERSKQPSALKSGEPVALLRFTKNLTVPIALVLLPKSIADTTGTVIGTLTDAQYCGSNAGTGRVLAQITAGTNAPAAANLRLGDCSSTLDVVAALHKNDKGFSGVVDLDLSWTAWSLTRSVHGVYPATPSMFSANQLGALSSFSDHLSTQNILISAPGGVSESFPFGLAFSSDTISAAFFQTLTAPAADWASQSSPATPISLPTANIQLSIAHTLVGQLATKYPNGFTYPNQIDGVSATLTSPSEMPISAGNSGNGVRLQADVHLSNPNFCTTTLTTDWYGAPLKFTSATTKTNDPGICKTIAAGMQTAVQQNLNGSSLSSSSMNDFQINVAGRQLSAHFGASYSLADIDYLSMFGNGSINVQ